MDIFNITETIPSKTKNDQKFDFWNVVNSGTMDKEQLAQATKLPWLNLWIRKEMRKSFARSKMTRENVQLFNSLISSQGFASDKAIKNFSTDSDLDEFIMFLGNMSIPEELKTKVSLSIMYPKLQFKD